MLHCCVVYQESDQSAVQLARRGETQRAVLVLPKGFMVETKVARRGVARSFEEEKKKQAKAKETLVKRKVTVQHVQHQELQQEAKKEKKKKIKE